MRNNYDNMSALFDNGLYIPSRTIFIEGEIDEGSAAWAIKGIHVLDNMSSAPITVILNTEGGDQYQGMAIYDAIKACRCQVTIRAIGTVMSSGSIILQAGDIREMTPNCMFMFHYGEIGIDSHPKITKKWVEEETRFSKKMLDIYLEKIRQKNKKFSRAKLDRMLDFDTILTAEETLELGLIDAIY